MTGTGALERLGRVPGVVQILCATVISGLAGYVSIWAVAGSVSVATYGLFAIFWSGLYLVIGALGGIQQEVTRSSEPVAAAPDVGRRARIVPFSIVAALIVLAVLSLSALFWAPLAFADAAVGLAIPLVIGAASYVLVACIAGTLYGLERWTLLAVMIAADGVLRLVGIGIAVAAGGGILAFAWVAALPFPIVVLAVLPVTMKRYLSRSALDVGFAALTGNVMRTLIGGIATAILISGFPFILKLLAAGYTAEQLAPLNLILTLTRGPIVLPFVALQSYLIVRFQAAGTGLLRGYAVLQTAIIAGSAAIGLIAGLVGPAIIVALFGVGYRMSGLEIGLIVGSSGVLAALCVSGAASLARSHHAAFAVGWVVAAITTSVLLALPLPIAERTILALLVGPLLGLVIHTLSLWSRRAASVHAM